VPKSIESLLAKTKKSTEEISLFVLHQANRFMLDHLRKKLAIPSDKFIFALSDFGNTVSSTIPIALEQAILKGRLKAGELALLSGFGVGYSWASALMMLPSVTEWG
jgi:3-oxoacyl-[acyl-carrier-protein] synthase-3